MAGNFTDAGLRHLEGLTGMWRLDVLSTNAFGSGAVQRLRPRLPNISRFNIAGNRQLLGGTNAGGTKNDAGGGAAGSRHPQPGAAAPLFDVTTLDGKPWRLADQRGKVVLLHFWNTACKPCVAGLPAMNRFGAQLQQKFGGRVVLIGLAMDDYEPLLRDVIEANQVTWPQARIGMLSKIAADYGVTGAPDDFLIGPDGNVLLNRESPDGTNAMAIIAAALKKSGAKKAERSEADAAKTPVTTATE
jgi:peroxiredoxin